VELSFGEVMLPFFHLSCISALGFTFLINFLLGYIHYTGGFVATIPIRLILYIIYIAPIISPSQPLSPLHLKQSQEVS
jgi:hypothetical protein